MKMIPHIFTNPFETRRRQNGRIPAEKEKILKPWQGLLVFAFLMVLFNLAGNPAGSCRRDDMEMRWTRSLYS